MLKRRQRLAVLFSSRNKELFDEKRSLRLLQVVDNSMPADLTNVSADLLESS